MTNCVRLALVSEQDHEADEDLHERMKTKPSRAEVARILASGPTPVVTRRRAG